ncbi:MAG: hypothetical protein LBE86_15040 [Gemmobacter sp.]|nr:hypothetical protein [Gemmobacter sp.]
MFSSEVCRPGDTRDQFTQLEQRRQIDPRRTYRHGDANHRIDHPSGDLHDNACRTRNLEKLASGAPLDAPYANLMAEIGMPAVMNFQFTSDMGRMNGRWPSAEKPGSSPDPRQAETALPSCIP